MLKVALRGLLARRLRFFMTTIAVALGVMLMAGSYIFTDTFSKGFDQLFASAFAGTDVSVSARTAFDLDETQRSPTLPASVLARVEAVDGVAAAEGSIFDQGATILDKRGRPITLGGAPQSIASASTVPELDSFRFPIGRAPRTGGEIALDEGTADRERFELGDTVRVQGEGPLRSLRLVGKLTLGGSSSIGGSSIALVTLAEAQALSGKPGRFDAVSAVAASGVTPEALRARVARALGPRYDVKTGQQEQEDQASEIRQGLGILRTALTVFAGIALFVGAFLIFNTFSITVAQRMRELALLRTLGASRRQVRRSVLIEGLAVGVIGSAIGLGLGVLIAVGLRALLSSFGIELPDTGLVIARRTVLLALGIGVAITAVSALLPALRAARVPPIAALQEGARLPPARGARLVTPLALVVIVLGLLLVGLGLGADDEDSGLFLRGIGALVAFVGLGLLARRAVAPLANAIGIPLERMRGLTGRLARENTMRQPARTAITASALMVGVALVVFALIFTSSVKSTLARAVDQNLLGDAVALDRGGQFLAFPDRALAVIARDRDVTTVSGISDARGLVLGQSDPSSVTGVDPDRFARVYDLDISRGPPDAIARLSAGSAIVDDDFATAHGIGVGDSLTLLTPTRRALTLDVIATKRESGVYALTGDVVVPNSVVRSDFGVSRDVFAIIALRQGVDHDAVAQRLDETVSRQFPRLRVQTDARFQSDQEKQIDTFLGVIFALLGLSIIVAVFGIVNTLVLAITERTRELGLLRAIGASRRQIRSMVRLEAVITALIGTVLGTIVGILFGLAVAAPAADLSFSIPVGSIVVVLVLGAAAGVLAAILPARKAARLDVLRSLAYE